MTILPDLVPLNNFCFQIVNRNLIAYTYKLAVYLKLLSLQRFTMHEITSFYNFALKYSLKYCINLMTFTKISNDSLSKIEFSDTAVMAGLLLYYNIQKESSVRFALLISRELCPDAESKSKSDCPVTKNNFVVVASKNVFLFCVRE